MSHEIIIKVEDLKKDFDLGKSKYEALKGISLEIKSTDFAIIYGPSGCGKSTLLNTITGLEQPTAGKVKVRDNDIYQMSENDRSRFRASKFGIVFQQPLWVKAMDLVHNVAMPLLIDGEKEKRACTKAIDLLNDVGMIKYAHHKLSELSGGQQQRAGIARALIHNPWILIADEPTGNLDTHSADDVMKLFQKLNVLHKRTIIMVTHNLIYLPLATKKIAMKDGLVSEGESEVNELVKNEYESVFGQEEK
jgi:putative ABC transport system ATP-binding protein